MDPNSTLMCKDSACAVGVYPCDGVSDTNEWRFLNLCSAVCLTGILETRLRVPAEKDIDRVVQRELFADAPSGVLVEVGAAKPDYLSMGASFRQLGWKVISIEPNPVFCELHRASGHEVLQYACSDSDADDVDFFVVATKDQHYEGGETSFEGFSSLGIHGRFAEDMRKMQDRTAVEKISVAVRRLDTILANHHPELDGIDLVQIDVEGWELSVLRGLSFTKYKPKVIVLENLHRSWRYRYFMWKHGFRRWKRLKPNEIFVPRRAGFHPFDFIVSIVQ